jgi:hypothetical protein
MRRQFKHKHKHADVTEEARQHRIIAEEEKLKVAAGAE